MHELVRAAARERNSRRPAATVPGMIEVQLTAGHFQLELYVDGYEFPALETGRDANALACEIELDVRRRLDLHAASRSPLILCTFELASFVDQLRTLEHAQDGQASFGNQTRSQAISSA